MGRVKNRVSKAAAVNLPFSLIQLLHEAPVGFEILCFRVCSSEYQIASEAASGHYLHPYLNLCTLSIGQNLKVLQKCKIR